MPLSKVNPVVPKVLHPLRPGWGPEDISQTSVRRGNPTLGADPLAPERKTIWKKASKTAQAGTPVWRSHDQRWALSLLQGLCRERAGPVGPAAVPVIDTRGSQSREELP